MHWDLGQRIMLWGWRLVAVMHGLVILACLSLGLAALVTGHWRVALLAVFTALIYATIAWFHRRFWRAFVR